MHPACVGILAPVVPALHRHAVDQHRVHQFPAAQLPVRRRRVPLVQVPSRGNGRARTLPHPAGCAALLALCLVRFALEEGIQRVFSFKRWEGRLDFYLHSDCS